MKSYKSKLRNLCYVLFIAQVSFSCVDSKEKKSGESTEVENDSLTAIKNPVLPGDFADPSVVRVGDDYWATATSSEWAPLYPILHSKNLKDWEIKGHVFPDSLPKWAEANFWAPEIAYDNGKYYIYYTARKKDGPLCVGVASAENPTGPYKDHGAIVCQEAGAIDGFQIRNDEGKLFLIWKEDGNSRDKPTVMWGQEMNEDRTELIGERFELFRNDPDSWEGKVVEGVYILKKNGYYYAFYAGGACCGRNCTYGTGVARAKSLKAPWEKYENNPIKQENEEWKCAGHGTMVQKENGRYYFLYHAYNKDGFVYTGRQGLLDEVVWEGEDGWPKFKENNSGKTAKDVEILDYEISFNTDELSKRWQWPVGKKPGVKLQEEKLFLEAKPDKIGALFAQRTLAPNYEAITEVKVPESSGNSGLAAIGDQNNAVGISVNQNEVFVWKVQKGDEEIIAKNPVASGNNVQLKVTVQNGHEYNFSWSENGENWKNFNDDSSLDGAYLPPWDRAVRIGLVSKGSSDFNSIFNFLKVNHKKE